MNMIFLTNIETSDGLPPFGPAFPKELVTFTINEKVKNAICISTKKASVIYFYF